MTAILTLIFSPIGRWVSAGAILLLALGGIYGKGRYDGRADYKATLAREVAEAIKNGDAAREKALKDFDSHSDLTDDGFMRK